jgi:hypothetical protein
MPEQQNTVLKNKAQSLKTTYSKGGFFYGETLNFSFFKKTLIKRNDLIVLIRSKN